jgi:hypothetical protein
MTYIIEAVIGVGSLAGDLGFPSAKVVALRQGLSLLPLTDALFDEIQTAAPNAGESLPRFEKLSTAVESWVRGLSSRGLAAYVEAEYFGGAGGQSAVAWRQGDVILEPVHSQDAINCALRLLGVDAGGEHDEFDAVGLGLRRSTDDWMKEGPLPD